MLIRARLNRSWFQLQRVAATSTCWRRLLLIYIIARSSEIGVWSSSEAIDDSIKHRIIRSTGIISHSLLFIFLRAVVLVIRGVRGGRLLVYACAVREPILQGTTRKHAFLFGCTVVSLSHWAYAFLVGSPLLLWKLHLVFLIDFIQVCAIKLNLLKLLNVAVNLVNMYLAGILFVEYFEHGLILLLIDGEVIISFHYSSSSH